MDAPLANTLHPGTQHIGRLIRWNGGTRSLLSLALLQVVITDVLAHIIPETRQYSENVHFFTGQYYGLLVKSRCLPPMERQGGSAVGWTPSRNLPLRTLQGSSTAYARGTVSSWGRYDDHRLVAGLAHRHHLINVDIERLSDKVGAGPEEVADAVFRWIEQYYDLGLSNAGNLWSTLDPDTLRLVTMLCKWRFPLQRH